MYRLLKNKLHAFVASLSDGRTVFALADAPATANPQDKHYHLVRADKWDPEKHTLGSFRPIEPLKSLVFRPREFLGSLAEHSSAPSVQERIVFGVKNCDLSALKIHDHVFLKTEPVDPFYAEFRDKTIIVSTDCTDLRPTCFCPAVDEQPYAKEGFDINISAASEHYIVEAGSERGKRLLDQAVEHLERADESLIEERDRNRSEMANRVCKNAEQAGLKCGSDLRKAIEKSVESALWDEFAEDCVECGACNFACCTCHCFLLADGRTPTGKPARVKQWDSCLYRNFATVAGGANPRKHRAERLYNRFDKKFSFFPQVLGTYACDGCGRCTEACTGKIDIRRVLKKAVDEL